MDSPVSIAICIPVDDGARSAFWLSLMRLIQQKKDYLPNVTFEVLTTNGDSLITRARNNLTHDFLHKTTADYLLFIDTDLDFTVQDIKTLVEHRREDAVVCGTYAIKQAELRFVHNVIKGQQPEPNGLLKVSEAGTGCMMIPRKILETYREAFKDKLEYRDDLMKDNRISFFDVGVIQYTPDRKRYYSEDYLFCRRVQQLGFSVYIHMDVLLKHHGWIAYPLEDSDLVKAIASRCEDATQELAQAKLTEFKDAIDKAVKERWKKLYPQNSQQPQESSKA